MIDDDVDRVVSGQHRIKKYKENKYENYF